MPHQIKVGNRALPGGERIFPAAPRLRVAPRVAARGIGFRFADLPWRRGTLTAPARLCLAVAAHRRRALHQG